MVAPGGHAWLLWGACMVAHGGMCVVAHGGVHGCSWGACMVAQGGKHAWLLQGEACMVTPGGGMHGFFQ